MFRGFAGGVERELGWCLPLGEYPYALVALNHCFVFTVRQWPLAWVNILLLWLWITDLPLLRGSGAWSGEYPFARGAWRPVSPLRRVTFVVAKVTKTGHPHIRPFAALRVPSLRCRSGAARFHSRLRLRLRWAAPTPLHDTCARPSKGAQVRGGAWPGASSRSGSVVNSRFAGKPAPTGPAVASS